MNTETTKICIELTDGRKMNAELYAQYAPISVANFVELAKAGFFRGLCFHRVIPGFVIQGGGFVQNKKELIHKSAPKNIKGEFVQNGVQNPIRHTAGVLSMARTNEPNSASSQFFVCVDDTPSLNGAYAAFGCLTDQESLKVAIDISRVKTTTLGYYADVPCEAVVIKDIVVL